MAQLCPGAKRFGQFDVWENIAASTPSSETTGAPKDTALRLVTTTVRALLTVAFACSPKTMVAGAISSAGATGTVTEEVSVPPPSCAHSMRKIRLVAAALPTNTPLRSLPLTDLVPLQSPLAEQLVTPALSQVSVTLSPDLTPVAGALLLNTRRAARPVAVSAADRRSAAASTTKVAERPPAESGDNRTVTAQLACAAIDVPQL